MIASHRCCRFVSSTSQIVTGTSHFTWRHSVGDSESQTGFLDLTRNQLEIIWALWHNAWSCSKYPPEDVHCSHKGSAAIFTGWMLYLNYSQFVLRGQKCAKQIIPPPLHMASHSCQKSKQSQQSIFQSRVFITLIMAAFINLLPHFQLLMDPWMQYGQQ